MTQSRERLALILHIALARHIRRCGLCKANDFKANGECDVGQSVLIACENAIKNCEGFELLMDEVYKIAREGVSQKEMKTNANTEVSNELNEAGKQLIEAARNFWVKHQNHCGDSAVVWLEDDSGQFVLFTRSEYKAPILKAANIETNGELPLSNPFVVPE